MVRGKVDLWGTISKSVNGAVTELNWSEIFAV